MKFDIPFLKKKAYENAANDAEYTMVAKCESASAEQAEKLAEEAAEESEKLDELRENAEERMQAASEQEPAKDSACETCHPEFDNIAEFRHVCIDYPLKKYTIRAVTDISLDIRRGKITALVGESGSGKSTVSSIISGLLKADKGQMQRMVKALLGMQEIARPDDAADALAVALTHANSINMKKLFKIQ